MSFPVPEITERNQPYWDGLAQGRLQYQFCAGCDACWLPPRDNCPNCLAPDPGWKAARGIGKVISWVVYHRAYADHLKERVPYDVTIVELDEGVRLLTNVIDSDAGRRLSTGARVVLAIEEEGGVALARFRLDPEGTGK